MLFSVYGVYIYVVEWSSDLNTCNWPDPKRAPMSAGQRRLLVETLINPRIYFPGRSLGRNRNRGEKRKEKKEKFTKSVVEYNLWRSKIQEMRSMQKKTKQSRKVVSGIKSRSCEDINHVIRGLDMYEPGKRKEMNKDLWGSRRKRRPWMKEPGDASNAYRIAAFFAAATKTASTFEHWFLEQLWLIVSAIDVKAKEKCWIIMLGPRIALSNLGCA